MNENMTPVDWAKRPIHKYADFSGRAPRAEYWWYTLGVVIVAVVISIIESILGLNKMIMGVYGPLSALFFLALLVPGIAVTARRLHDTNRSGWWMLIAIVPYAIVGFMAARAAASGSVASLGTAGIVSLVALVGAIVLLVFLVLPGTPGDNRFGPNPYGAGGAATAA